MELCEGDSVTYRIDCSGLARVRIAASAAEGLSADGGSGYVSIGQCGGEAVVRLDGKLSLVCASGKALLDYIEVFEL